MSKAIRCFDPENNSKPTVWAAEVCPFAAKALIALYEMGIEFDHIEVNLRNKPDSLFEVNKKGQVPAMKDQGNALADSYIILQYIDEMWKNPARGGLMPSEPAQRAVVRTWCEYINTVVVKHFYAILLKKSEEERTEAKTQLLEAIKTIDKAMRSISVGPFFMGSEFGMADIMLSTHVERFPVLEQLRDFKIPDTKEYERFKSWWKEVQEVKSFQRAKCNLEVMLVAYKSYAEQ